MLERETMIEGAAAFGPVLLMLAAMMAIGVTFRGDAGLTKTGGQALVGVLVGFVLLMTVVGIWMARSDHGD